MSANNDSTKGTHQINGPAGLSPYDDLTGSFFEDRLKRELELAKIISLVGCASHSSARPHTPSTVVEDITFEGAAIIQTAKAEAVRTATLAERERLLPLIQKAKDTQLALFRMCWDKNIIELVKQVGMDIRAIEESLRAQAGDP